MSTTRKAETPGPLTHAVAAELRAGKAVARLSVSDLAKLSGIGERSLHRYLNAERVIGLESLDKVAAALGTTSETLIVAAERRRRVKDADEAPGETEPA